MQVQYLTNEKGEKTAVQLSLKEWADIQQRLRKLEILESLKDSVKEVKQIISGKKKGTAAKDLLNEL